MQAAHSKLGPDVVTVAEAATLLGISRQAVSAGLKRGRLRYWHEGGRIVVARDGLERRWWGSSQRIADRPQQRQQQQQAPDWQRIAPVLNDYLPNWPAPPWSADQCSTVAMCLSLAMEATASDA